ncbi:MAG TPA: hypothetical protein VEQ37_03390 [Actinomycetota bacterium]|nr:hypothetical protein [Actinomycetota bacterium]
MSAEEFAERRRILEGAR